MSNRIPPYLMKLSISIKARACCSREFPSLFLKVGTTGGLSCPTSICMDDGDLNSHLQIYEANTLTIESCPQF